MKKILIMSIVSLSVTVSSLWVVDSFLLKDSSVKLDSLQVTKTVNDSSSVKIGYLGGGYDSLRLSEDKKKSLIVNDDMLYLMDFESITINRLNTSNFVFFADFINDNDIVYFTKENGSLIVTQYNINTGSETLLGKISLRNLSHIVSVWKEEGYVKFDIALDDKGSTIKNYSIKNDKIVLTPRIHDVDSFLNIDDTNIVGTLDGDILVDNTQFSLEGSDSYTLVGGSTESVIYVQDNNNPNRFISVAIGDSMEVLSEINLTGFEYDNIFVSDKLYLINKDTLYLADTGVKIELPQDSIALFANNDTIYYALDGLIYTNTFN